MALFLGVAIVLGLAALFGFVNERYLYAIAEHLDVSGPIAVVVAGIVVQGSTIGRLFKPAFLQRLIKSA